MLSLLLFVLLSFGHAEKCPAGCSWLPAVRTSAFPVTFQLENPCHGTIRCFKNKDVAHSYKRSLRNDSFEYDANNYLLSRNEIATASSKILPRNARGSLSSGVHVAEGDVELIANGDLFFRHMLKNIRATEKGDFLLLTGWDVHTEMLLDPKEGEYETTGLLVQLKLAMDRGVNVGIIWTFIGNTLDALQMTEVCSTIDLAWQERTGDKNIGGCFFDTKVQETHFQSSHAKSMYLTRGDVNMAYISGLDIAPERWDTGNHGGQERDFYLSRQPAAGLAQIGTGWADAGAFVKGQLALDVRTTFSQRWSDLGEKTLTPWPIPALLDLPEFDEFQPNRPAGQVVRTFAGRNDDAYANFAPEGEVTHAHAIQKMIKGAKEFVLVYDQYAYAKDIERILNYGAVATTIVTQELDSLAIFNNLALYRQEQALNLPDCKIYAIQFPELVPPNGPRPEPSSSTYVHSKVIIVDGMAAIVGSANFCQRSFFTDHEITVAVVDPVVVRSFMIDLAAEWLSVDALELELLSNVEIHQLIRSRPASFPTHLAAYTPDGDKPFEATEELWETVGDPDLSELPRWHGES